MPRVSTKTVDEVTKPAPRKRAVRRVVTKDETVPVRRPRAPRRVTTPEKEIIEAVPARRAPTSLAAAANTKSKKQKTVIFGASIVIAVFGIAAWIGSTDAGQINVEARMEAESKKQPQATEAVGANSSNEIGTVPVEGTPPPPAAISGLRGRGVGTPDVVAEVPPITEATSTEIIATTTEEVISPEASDQDSSKGSTDEGV